MRPLTFKNYKTFFSEHDEDLDFQKNFKLDEDP